MEGKTAKKRRVGEEKLLAVIFLAPAVILILGMTVLPIIIAINILNNHTSG